MSPKLAEPRTQRSGVSGVSHAAAAYSAALRARLSDITFVRSYSGKPKALTRRGDRGSGIVFAVIPNKRKEDGLRTILL